MFNGLDELEDFASRLAPPTPEEEEAARHRQMAVEKRPEKIVAATLHIYPKKVANEPAAQAAESFLTEPVLAVTGSNSVLTADVETPAAEPEQSATAELEAAPVTEPEPETETHKPVTPTADAVRQHTETELPSDIQAPVKKRFRTRSYFLCALMAGLFFTVGLALFS